VISVSWTSLIIGGVLLTLVFRRIASGYENGEHATMV